MKRVLLAVLAVVVAVPLFAGVSSKFKDWSNSPQGYFMTKAEKAQWSAINTDADAQAFVDKFVASRGGDAWTAEVAKRAEMADRYLTVSKTPGSKSLRGKAVVLFGPPTSMTVTDASDLHTTRDNPAMASAMTSGGASDSGSKGGGAGGAAGSSGPESFGSELVTGHAIRNFDMGFAAVPGGAVNVTFIADVQSGKDRVAKGMKELEAAFDRAAETSIKTK
jgi:GWxTD domain-containing protein